MIVICASYACYIISIAPSFPPTILHLFSLPALNPSSMCQLEVSLVSLLCSPHSSAAVRQVRFYDRAPIRRSQSALHQASPILRAYRVLAMLQ